MVTLFLRKSMEEDLGPSDRDDLIDTLVEQGHNPHDIHTALSIVEKIQQRLEFPLANLPRRMDERFFMNLEEFHLNAEVRGYLNQMVQLGVLKPEQREEIIERSLLMDTEDITVGEVEAMMEDLLSNHRKLPGEFDETVSDYYH
jgi:uncharacterized protein Smg (DUF494 family)